MTKAWLTDADGSVVDTTRQRVDFAVCGVGLLSTKTLGIVLKDVASTDNIVVKVLGSTFKLYTIADGEITADASQTKTIPYGSLQLSTAGGVNYGFMTIILGWEPQDVSISDPDVDRIQVSIAGAPWIDAPIFAESEGISDRHAVFVNNFKRGITDEYISAMRTTDFEQEVQDPMYMNLKTRELLLNLFDIDVQVGNYDNLFKVLSFFEWDDFVRIKEYWQSLIDPNDWKASDVTSQVADVFVQQDGYKKTRFLGLFYDLNAPDGTFDEDGIPYYVRIAISFISIMTKLNTLKRILQRDFLPDDVQIIDIVGEFTTFCGIDVNIFLNSATFFTFTLNHDIARLNLDIDMGLGADKTIFLSEHKVLTVQNLYNIVGDTVASKGEPTHFGEKIFEIYAADDELTDHTWGDFELLQNFYRADMGLITFKTTVRFPIPPIYYGYKILIEEQYEDEPDRWYQAYLSAFKPISTIEDPTRIGIKKLGTYRINFIFFDGWGGMSTISDKLEFKVLETIIQLQAWRPQYLTDDSDSIRKMQREIQEIDTYQHESGSAVYDASLEPLAYPVDPEVVPYKFYADISRIANTASPLFREIDFNLIASQFLDKVPMIEYSRFFEVLIWDVLGESPVNGDEIAIRTRLFPTHEWSLVSAVYDDSEGDVKFLKYFCQLLRDYGSIYPESPFGKFTYNVYSHSIDGTLANKRSMIVMQSKVNDYELNTHWFVSTTNVSLFGTNKIVPYGRNDATIRFELDRPIDEAFSEVDLMLRVYLGQTKIIDAVCTSYQDLYDQLKAYESTHGRDIWVQKDALDSMIVLSSRRYDVRVEHTVIGNYQDVVRNTHIENFVSARIGDDFAIGSTVYMQIDEEEKFDNGTFRWRVYDTFTNQIVHEDYNKMMRVAVMKEGIYDVELSIMDLSWSATPVAMSVRKNGAIRVA